MTGHSKVAISIPTMDRPDFLERALKYYVSSGFAGGVLVGDASPGKEAMGENKQVVDAAKKDGLEVEHFDLSRMYDPKSRTSRFGMQLEFLGNMAQERKYAYCIHAGDDDFIVPAGVGACVDFLEKDSSFIGAYGSRIRFSLDRQGPYGRVAQIDQVRYPDYAVYDPLERCRRYIRQSFTLQFAVVRTSVWNDAHSRQWEVPIWYLGNELMVNLLLAAAGRFRSIDMLSVVFQLNRAKPFGFEPGGWSMYDLLKDPRFSMTFRNLRLRVLRALKGCDDAEAVLDELLFGHFAFLLAGHWNIRNEEVVSLVAMNDMRLHPFDPFYTQLQPILDLLQGGKR